MLNYLDRDLPFVNKICEDIDMVIAYQSSELFSDICLVSLYSVLINNLNDRDMYIYILSKDFSDQSLNRVKNMMDKLGFNKNYASVIDISNIADKNGLVFDDYNGKWGIDSFCKLLLGTLLPNSITRVIYLDSDTIVCGNLSKIYNMNLDNYVVAGTKDFLSKEYFDYFGLDNNDIYCNSGMLLINLDNWRKCAIEKKISDYLKKVNGQVFFSEQTVLNIVCRKQICALGLEYNLTSISAFLNYKQLCYLRQPYNGYSREEIKRALKKPVIIHYTSLFLIRGRIWNYRNNHPFRETFDIYARSVPEFKKNDLPIKKAILFRLNSVIPKNITCFVVGYYYCYGRLEKYKKYCRMKNAESIEVRS